MNKKRRLIVGGLTAGILLSIGIFWGVRGYREKENIQIIIREDTLEDILFYEGRKIGKGSCVISNEIPDFLFFSEGYVCLCNFKYKRNLWTTEDVSRAQVDIYDISSGKWMGSLDIKEEAEKFFPEKYWIGSVDVIQKEGESYVETTFLDFNEYWEVENRSYIYFNIDTNTMTILYPDEYADSSIPETRTEVLERAKEFERNMYILKDKELGLLEKNGFRRLRWDDYEWVVGGIVIKLRRDAGIAVIEIQKGSLPEENAVLYTEFPELKNYVGEDNDMVCFFLEGYPTPEEILSMLIEEGEEISFEGCILPAESSIDGKEHEIHSFEEYEQWKKYEE